MPRKKQPPTLIDNLYKQPKKDKGVNAPHFQQYQPGQVYQADLLFLPDHDGYKYALVVVDIGIPHVTDAEPLKLRNGDAIIRGFQSIFQRGILSLPQKIEFDAGTEFNDAQKWFEKKGVLVKRGKPYRHRQLAMVERRNQIIGKQLFKRMTEQELLTKHTSREWTNDLPKIISDLNARDKKKKRINSIKLKLSDDVECSGDACNILSEGMTVRVALDAPIDVVSGRKLHGKFRDSDIKWSLQPRTIMQVIVQPNSPPMYLLDDPKNKDKTDHSAAYTKNQLMVVDVDETQPTHTAIRPIIDKGVEKYIVDHIIDKKKIKGRIYYKVLWKGYPEDQATFEKRTTLLEDVPEIVRNYEQNKSSS